MYRSYQTKWTITKEDLMSSNCELYLKLSLKLPNWQLKDNSQSQIKELLDLLLFDLLYGDIPSIIDKNSKEIIKQIDNNENDDIKSSLLTNYIYKLLEKDFIKSEDEVIKESTPSIKIEKIE